MSVEFQNNGLLPNSKRPDFGRGLLLNDSTAFGLFKVPSLRNWVYSKPYMHDGRFSRISEVLHHYSEGPFNDWPSNSDFKQGLNLSSNQKTELMAFLKTLNDSAFVFDHGQQLSKDFLKKPKE